MLCRDLWGLSRRMHSRVFALHLIDLRYKKVINKVIHGLLKKLLFCTLCDGLHGATKPPEGRQALRNPTTTTGVVVAAGDMAVGIGPSW